MIAGDCIGPYRVVRLVSEGGTGRVYRCEHVHTGGHAAVKVPRGKHAVEREALRRESFALARLETRGHRGLVGFIARGTMSDGSPWYAMEYIHGQDLRTWMDSLWRAPARLSEARTATQTAAVEAHPHGVELEPESASRPASPARELTALCALGARIAGALSALHAEGLVHGDLSPRNVLLRAADDPVLIDFGESFRVFESDRSREVAARPLMRGTAGYIAPELMAGDSLDARCDCYALGCILYELFTGHQPFGGTTRRYVRPEAPSHYRPEIPAGLDALILRLLATEPSERWGRANDVAARLWRIAGVTDEAEPPRGGHTVLFRPRLIERDAALDVLLSRAREAGAGHGGVVLVAGESGVGKTRLVNQLAARAPALRMRVVSSQCTPPVGGSAAAGSRHLEPLCALIEGFIDAALDRAEHLLVELEDALAALEPYIRDLLATLRLSKVAEPLSPELARARVIRSVVQILSRFAEERPVLLIIDDLQWADDLTLDVLLDCHKSLENSAALLIATYRREELTDGLRLLRNSGALDLTIDRLSTGAIAAVGREMLGVERLPEGFSEFLFEHSEGNPFFAAEYLRAALAHGYLKTGHSGDWQFQAGELLAIPTTLEELFGLRLVGLSESCRAALELASVLGREFEAELFHCVLGKDDQSGVSALEELVAREILEWLPPGRYRFVHDKLREAQERAMLTERRRYLHGEAARWLEASHAVADAALAERVGSHWVGAGECERALPHLQAAARAAAAAHAPGRAAALYRLAIEQWKASVSGAGEPLGALYEGLGDMLVMSARHEEGRTAYLEAAASFGGLRVALARVYRKHANSCWTLHEYARADESFERARQALGTAAPNDHEAAAEQLAIQLSRFEQLYFSRQIDDTTLRAFRDLQPLVDEYAPPGEKCHYYVGCSGLTYAGGRYAFSAEAVAFARTAVDLKDGQIPLNQMALAKLSLGFALMAGNREDRRDAIAWLHLSEVEALRAGDTTLATRALVYRTLSHLRLGEVSRTRELAERVLAAAASAQLAPYVAAAHAFDGWASWRTNDLPRAKALTERALQSWRTHAHAYPFQWVALVPLMDLYIAEERFLEACRLVSELTHVHQQALPAELEQTLRELGAACEAGAVREIHCLMTNVSGLLRESGFG